MGVWDTTTPAGSDLLSLGDDKIREMKVALQESLRGQNTEGVESVFPGSFPSTAPVFRYRGIKDTTGNRPASGQYGLFFDTTRNVLQRDNGSTWDDVGTVIPSGTKMVFYQASAPVGWTAVAVNDKFLRVVTAGGTGGATGGTVAASTSLEHAHAVESHTHTTSEHSHLFEYDTLTTDAVVYSTPTFSNAEFGIRVIDQTSPFSYGDAMGEQGDDGRLKYKSGGSGSLVTQSYRSYGYPYTKPDGGGIETSGATPNTDSKLGVFAYADVIVASKD